MNLQSFYKNIKEINKDNEVRLPKSVERLPGSKDAVKDYQKTERTKNNIETDKNFGSNKAAKRYNAEPQKKLDTYVSDDRELGPSGMKKNLGKYGVLQSFRNEIRSTLGLPLDSKLNRGNDGI